ncbi:MAG: putative aminopeptidase [Gemmatimonadaceae bacterium]|nr:putative aminopeptidase [Gemmatimonadaceae bacterium]
MGIRSTVRRRWMYGLVVAGIVAADAATAQGGAATGLTVVKGIKVGHYRLTGRPTGCTVVLAEKGVVGGVDVRGAAPGTRETDLLDPVNTVSVVHAIVLAGGSAFGLDAAGGVMRYLEERGVGFDTRVAKVPIVPAAILFDLGVGDPKIRPTADCGYRAAKAATSGPVAEGNVGAGAGATVGKLMGGARSMKAGVGTASITLPDGLVVAALAVVNALGDIVDPSTGQVVAGVRSEDGSTLADARKLIRSGATRRAGGRGGGENTTLGVVATNARLTKAQARKIAQMAHDGYARAISPVHTAGDGDTIFSLATGERAEEADVTTIGALAADAMAEAILRAARQATGLPNLPAARDLSHKR